MTISQWYPTVAGKRVNSCGGILGECVALVQKYANEVLGVNGCPVFPVPAARLMVGARPDAFTWIPNTPTGIPPYGAIVVFNGRVGGGYGHTGVAIEGCTLTQVRCIQQNDPLGTGVSIKVYPYTNVSGWLVKKETAPVVVNKGDNDMIQAGDNYYARANKLHTQVRGRALPKEVFNLFVGKSWLHFIETLSDDPEANNWYENGQVGSIARRDNWQKQITDAVALVNKLQEQLIKSEATTTELTKKVDELNSKVNELQSPDNIVVTRGFFNTLFDRIRELIKRG